MKLTPDRWMIYYSKLISIADISVWYWGHLGYEKPLKNCYMKMNSTYWIADKISLICKKMCSIQDVVRTCPENGVFKEESIRSMMINILFIYCKEHQSLSYRQVNFFVDLKSNSRIIFRSKHLSLHWGSKICCKGISSPTLKNVWRNIPFKLWNFFLRIKPYTSNWV